MKLRKKAVRSSGLLFIVILTIFAGLKQAYCQENNPATVSERLLRIEIPAKSDNETYRLIPCGEKGVILFYKSVEVIEPDKVKWYFSFYDKDLQTVWTKSIGLVNAFDYKDFYQDADTICLLFRIGDKIKDAPVNFQVVRLTLSQGNFIGNGLKLPENADVVDFIVYRDMAYIGFNIKNEAARLLMVNLQDGNQFLMTLGEGTVSSLIQMYLDAVNEKVYTATRKIILRNQSEFVLSAFGQEGKLISEVAVVSPNAEHNLNALRFMPLSDREIVIAGTYGSPPVQKGSSGTMMPGESTGFFFSRVYDNQQQSINYYNFLDLRNASQIISRKNMLDLKKKSAKKEKDPGEYSLDVTLLLQPIAIKNNEILLMAESFFPQYHTENYTDYDFYGRPFTNTYSVFDGYRYTNFIIAGFDKDGKMLWDNALDIRNLLSFELTPRVTIFEDGKNLVMIYLSEGKIASKIIHHNDVVEKLDYTPVEMQYPNDKLVSETKSRMVPWYDKFFLCYGYQEIKNVVLERNNKRLVFYFSKIRFE